VLELIVERVFIYEHRAKNLSVSSSGQQKSKRRRRAGFIELRGDLRRLARTELLGARLPRTLGPRSLIAGRCEGGVFVWNEFSLPALASRFSHQTTKTAAQNPFKSHKTNEAGTKKAPVAKKAPALFGRVWRGEMVNSDTRTTC
jgi:hypothetical protein